VPGGRAQLVGQRVEADQARDVLDQVHLAAHVVPPRRRLHRSTRPRRPARGEPKPTRREQPLDLVAATGRRARARRAPHAGAPAGSARAPPDVEHCSRRCRRAARDQRAASRSSSSVAARSTPRSKR
jgi:hypothetical protein